MRRHRPVRRRHARTTPRTKATLLAALGLIGGAAVLASSLPGHAASMSSVLSDDTIASYDATVSGNGAGATVYAYPGDNSAPLNTSLPSAGTLAEGSHVQIQCYLTATDPVTGPDGNSDLYWDQIDTSGITGLSPMPAAGDVPVVPDAYLATSLPVNQVVSPCPATSAAPTVAPSPTVGSTPTPTPGTTPVPVPPIPAPATPSTSYRCQVDLRAKWVRQANVSTPFRHMYIIYTDAIGRQSIFRGGPANDNPLNLGPIVAVDVPYQLGAPDWSTTDPSTAIEQGATACGRAVCFASEVDRINSLHIPYVALAPARNSNSVAYTILTNCGLPQSPSNPPYTPAPGWGKLL